MSDLLTKLEEKSQADSEAVKAAQDHFHAVSAGLSSNEGGEDKTLADQIMSKCTTSFDGIRFLGGLTKVYNKIEVTQYVLACLEGTCAIQYGSKVSYHLARLPGFS